MGGQGVVVMSVALHPEIPGSPTRAPGSSEAVRRLFMALYVRFVIVEAILGGLFRVNAVAFVEDVNDDWTNQDQLQDIYTSVSNNCFFAAGAYLLFLVFSAWQYKLGSSGHFQVS